MQRNHSQWPEVASLIAGGCLAASPWVLDFSTELTKLFYSALATGLAVALLSLVELVSPAFGAKQRAELPIAKLVVGMWAVSSPWILGFAIQQAITITTVLCGGVAAAAALWQLVDRYQHIHHLFE